MSTNLQFIKEFNNTASTSSVSLTNIFNADYDVYKIFITHLSTNSNVSYLYQRFLDSGGSVISDSEYDYAGFDLHCDTTFGERKNTSAAFMEIHFVGGTTFKQLGGIEITVFNPNDTSSYTFLTTQGSVEDDLNGTQLMGHKGFGVHKSAEQITGVNFSLSDSATLDEGMKFSVYGVKE